MNEGKLLIPAIIGSYLLGFFTGDVFGPHTWEIQAPPEVEVVEIEHEPLSMGIEVVEIPLECPVVKCPNFTAPDCNSRRIDRAWRKYETAANRFSRVISDLEYAQISCDNAFYGWSFATTQWQAACNGEKVGVCE